MSYGDFDSFESFIYEMQSGDCTTEAYIHSLAEPARYAYCIPNKQIVNDLVNDLLQYVFVHSRKSVVDLYCDVFAKYGRIDHLDEISPAWVEPDDYMSLAATSVIIQLCLDDFSRISELLNWVDDGRISKHLDDFNAMKKEILPEEMKYVSQYISRILKVDSTKVKVMQSSSTMLSRTRIEKSVLRLIEFYDSVIYESTRRYQFAWLFLTDFVMNAFEFSDYVLRGLFEIISPPSQFKRYDIESLCKDVALRCLVRSRKQNGGLQRGDITKFAELINTRIDKAVSTCEHELLSANGCKNLQDFRTFVAENVMYICTNQTWSNGVSRMYSLGFDISEETVGRLVRETILNEIYKSIRRLGSIDELALAMPEIRKVLNDFLESVNYNMFTDEIQHNLSDYCEGMRTQKLLLNYFFNEVTKNTGSDPDLILECQNKDAQIDEMTKRINELNRQLEILKLRSMAGTTNTPIKMSIDSAEHNFQQLEEKCKKLQEELNEQGSEISVQNDYIVTLQDLLTQTGEHAEELEECQNSSEDDKIIFAKVAVFGNLTGADQSRVLEHLPNAIFISDQSRDIPVGVPAIVVVCRMKHKLMFKIAAVRNNQDVYYYNGKAMKNVYRALPDDYQ